MFLFILKWKSRENQLKLVFFGAEIKHFLIVSQKNQLFYEPFCIIHIMKFLRKNKLKLQSWQVVGNTGLLAQFWGLFLEKVR